MSVEDGAGTNLVDVLGWPRRGSLRPHETLQSRPRRTAAPSMAAMSRSIEPSQPSRSSRERSKTKPRPRPSVSATTTGACPPAASRTSAGWSLRWNVSKGIGNTLRHAAHSGRSLTDPWVMSHRAQCRRPRRAPNQYDSSPRNVASASYTPMRRTIRDAGRTSGTLLGASEELTVTASPIQHETGHSGSTNCSKADYSPQSTRWSR